LRKLGFTTRFACCINPAAILTPDIKEKLQADACNFLSGSRDSRVRFAALHKPDVITNSTKYNKNCKA
ncbi:MAG: hypothetical protein ACJAU8_000232, partial [Candidatus Paceibacteria bacterium]